MDISKYKIIIFDMDDTITPSRSLIDSRMYDALIKLTEIKDVVIISGAQISQIEKQIPDILTHDFFVLSQSGNIAQKFGVILWANELNHDDEQEIFSHIFKIVDTFGINCHNYIMIEHRGCQISFSAVGHNAPRYIKEQFDPDKTKRKMWLEKIPFNSKRIEVNIGGTTCLDYFRKGCNKGNNIKRLFEMFGYDSKTALFIGDAIYNGGNDSSVIGVCDVYEVKDWKETFELVNKVIE